MNRVTDRRPTGAGCFFPSGNSAVVTRVFAKAEELAPEEWGELVYEIIPLILCAAMQPVSGSTLEGYILGLSTGSVLRRGKLAEEEVERSSRASGLTVWITGVKSGPTRIFRILFRESVRWFSPGMKAGVPEILVA